MSDERINSITASSYSITPELTSNGNNIRVNLNRSLRQHKITCTHGTIVNIYVITKYFKTFNYTFFIWCR